MLEGKLEHQDSVGIKVQQPIFSKALLDGNRNDLMLDVCIQKWQNAVIGQAKPHSQIFQ